MIYKRLVAFMLYVFIGFVSEMKTQHLFSGTLYLRDTSTYYLNQVYVTNLNTHKTVLSSYDGSFSISVNEGDIIRFTSVVTERKDLQITKKILEIGENFIELKVAYYEIEEILISKFRPSTNLKKDVLSLKTGQKKMKLAEAIGLPTPNGSGLPADLPVMSLANGGLSLSVDAIYDIFFGNRTRKKRLRDYELMMKHINDIRMYYGEDYFLKLKIPKNMIDNFLQFVYGSDNLKPFLDNNNFEIIKIFIEKYQPIYSKRLQNSNFMKINDY